MKVLAAILLAVAFFALAMVFMAIGIIFRGRAIQHTCGATRTPDDRCPTCHQCDKGIAAGTTIHKPH